jgi:hypothetical protein
LRAVRLWIQNYRNFKSTLDLTVLKPVLIITGAYYKDTKDTRDINIIGITSHGVYCGILNNQPIRQINFDELNN